MLKRKLQRVATYMALIAMSLATFVPSLSMAFPMENGRGSVQEIGFVQEICTTSGQKLYINVVTTQGKQIKTALDLKPTEKPVSITHHLNHCPFCNMQMDEVVMPSANPACSLYQLALAKQQLNPYFQPAVAEFHQTAHPSRAPPLTSS